MRWVVFVLGLAMAALSLWQIEAKRPDALVVSSSVGATPVTRYTVPGGLGPVLVSHGFAGSRPLMQAITWTLAGNGYNVVTYDLEGHGLNPTPMSGDVDDIEGTTRLLVDEMIRVMEYTGDRPALVGHSMATDILVRAAAEHPAGPIVAVSAFSGAVTADHPADLLLIAGAWEGRLIEFGRDAIHQIDPAATEGQIVGDRMALVAPRVEHVGILYSPYTLREMVQWLDRAYGVPEREPELATIGYWVLLLLAALMVLWWPLSRLLPARNSAAEVPRKALWWCAAVSLSTPLAVFWIELGFLPVLVADYLALHLGFAGLFQLYVLRYFRVPFGRISWVAVAALTVWGLAVFGLAIDRYAANFQPNAERALILAALSLGAVPFMAADAIATQGGMAPLWRRMVLRGAFFASLILAVAIDFEGLFFLILIAPIILLFFLIFGLMGRWTAARSGPLAPGIALGLILAWSLGVTFPLFQA
ncbi:MAG: alpha/beta hydrolase [Pseudomonadota bacterium]